MSIRLHDDFQAIREWKGASVSSISYVVKMMEDVYNAALTFKDSLLPLDRYFLIVLVLEKLKSLNSGGNMCMEIITKAKKSCTAFEKPSFRKTGKGRPPKRGAAVHLKKLFISHKEQFCEVDFFCLLR